MRVLPLVAAAAVPAVPLAQYVHRVRAESAGGAFVQRLVDAQEAFRRQQPGVGGFATAVESLTTACPGEASPPLSSEALTRVADLGFAVSLRPAEGAQAALADCHGRTTASDYYAAIQPSSVDAAPRLAFALTGSSGRVFVFFDGIAPLERDMAPGGLATPLDAVRSFRIP
jgi:hypothetical protein